MSGMRPSGGEHVSLPALSQLISRPAFSSEGVQVQCSCSSRYTADAVCTQIGGVGSACGILGIWSGINHTEDDPCGLCLSVATSMD